MRGKVTVMIDYKWFIDHLAYLGDSSGSEGGKLHRVHSQPTYYFINQIYYHSDFNLMVADYQTLLKLFVKVGSTIQKCY